MAEQFFVYVDAGRHLWRFVYCNQHETADEAIHAAQREAIDMENEPASSYMAVPYSAITTKWAVGTATDEAANG